MYLVEMDLLKVFVDGVVTRPHGERWEHQIEEHQSQHVGHIVPVEKRFIGKYDCLIPVLFGLKKSL